MVIMVNILSGYLYALHANLRTNVLYPFYEFTYECLGPSPPILRPIARPRWPPEKTTGHWRRQTISMRVALCGIRKAFPNVRQVDTGELEKFIQGNKFKNLILLVSIIALINKF